MQDEDIVSLYWDRDETAISLTGEKYGNYLGKIAYNILADWQESEESVNSTYLKAWNSMPPHRPGCLCTYLAKIVRQLSIDVFRKKHSEKRQASQYALSLTELQDCAGGEDSTAEEVDLRLLGEAISDFLQTLPKDARALFDCRYFFLDSVKEAAASFGFSEAKAKSALFRIRNKLKEHLTKEGFPL